MVINASGRWFLLHLIIFLGGEWLSHQRCCCRCAAPVQAGFSWHRGGSGQGEAGGWEGGAGGGSLAWGGGRALMQLLGHIQASIPDLHSPDLG